MNVRIYVMQYRYFRLVYRIHEQFGLISDLNGNLPEKPFDH